MYDYLGSAYRHISKMSEVTDFTELANPQNKSPSSLLPAGMA